MMFARFFSSRFFLFALLVGVIGLCVRITQVARTEASLQRELRRINSSTDKEEIEKRIGRFTDPSCKNPEYIFEAGKIAYRNLQNPRKARPFFEQSIRLNPFAAKCHYYLGAVALSLRDWQTAQRSFESAAHLDPLNADLYVKIGKNYFLAWRITGEPHFALSGMEKLRCCATVCPGSVGNCLELAKRELPGNDNEFNIFADTLSGEVSLAEYLLQLKRYDEARKVYEKIEESHPALERERGIGCVEFLINSGTALLMCANLKESKARYENALAQTNDKDRDEALKRLYLCFHAAQKTAEGLQFWQELTKKYPVNWRIWFNIGIAHLELGNFAEAETAFQKAISIQETPETFYHLAVLYAKLGENPFARKNLREATRLDYRNPAYHYELAKLYETDKMISDAAAEMKAAIELAPEEKLYRSELDRLLLLYPREPKR
jgi:tetratricopeptide (TPR) repeat protein